MNEAWTSRLEIEVDQVLRGQGADPQAVRLRNPRLVKIAEQAIEAGAGLLRPQVFQQRLKVRELRHERLLLEGGGRLSGPLIGKHLGSASEVVAILCTVGSDLERYTTRVWSGDMVLGLALDGLGSAAVEMLANRICSQLEEQARAEDLQASIPLSPGMDGWPVEIGQPEIFGLWATQPAQIELTETMLMIPRKSLSMVIGLGGEVERKGEACDYCALRATCRYQDHYIAKEG